MLFRSQMEVPILDTIYTDIVEAELLVAQELMGALKKKLTEATNGKAVLTDCGQVWYGELDKEIQIFDEE